MNERTVEEVPDGVWPSEAGRQNWSLPLKIDSSGSLGTERPEVLEETVRLIVEVCPGERPLLPEFGCRIHSLPSISTETERHVAAVLIEEALQRWAPGLGVERVEVVDASDTAVRLAVHRRGERRRFRVSWYAGRNGRQSAEAPSVEDGGNEA